ncbi:MAG TPA: hypothetical protein VIK53_01175 [Verrucomicrobiae bacterium]
MTAALALSASDAFAQIGNGGGGGGGGGGFGNGGGGGGGFGNGGGGGGRRNRGGGNFDPAQMMQRQMDYYRQALEFTNDTDWDAVSPLVQKVMDARTAVGNGGRGGFGGRGGRGGGGGGGGGMFGGQTSPEEDALQKAIDEDAPAAQIKDLLAKYRAAHKVAQAKFLAAQADLKAVLTVKQEAQATLMGLVD